MENPCKTTIDEKHFKYPRLAETNISKDITKSEVKNVDCPKKGFFGRVKSGDPPPPELLVSPPPPYPDLGKQAKDVFDKGYNFGLIRLDCNTTTKTGVNFHTGGESNSEDGSVSGFLETNYLAKDYGVTFKEKWTTDCALTTGLSVQDQITKGLTTAADFTFVPPTGDTSGKVKAVFQNDMVALTADADLSSEKRNISASGVIGYQGWLAGCQGIIDIKEKSLAKTSFALGFSTADFVLHTCIDIASGEGGGGEGDGEEGGGEDAGGGEEGGDEGGGKSNKTYCGSIYQKISPKLECGVQVSWSPGGENTILGLAARYELDQDAILRAKVTNEKQIGLGYQQRLRDGITLILSTLIDGNGNGHKVGLALELEA